MVCYIYMARAQIGSLDGRVSKIKHHIHTFTFANALCAIFTASLQVLMHELKSHATAKLANNSASASSIQPHVGRLHATIVVSIVITLEKVASKLGHDEHQWANPDKARVKN